MICILGYGIVCCHMTYLTMVILFTKQSIAAGENMHWAHIFNNVSAPDSL